MGLKPSPDTPHTQRYRLKPSRLPPSSSCRHYITRVLFASRRHPHSCTYTRTRQPINKVNRGAPVRLRAITLWFQTPAKRKEQPPHRGIGHAIHPPRGRKGVIQINQAHPHAHTLRREQGREREHIWTHPQGLALHLALPVTLARAERDGSFAHTQT